MACNILVNWFICTICLEDELYAYISMFICTICLEDSIFSQLVYSTSLEDELYGL